MKTELPDPPLLKHFSSDFQVRESLVLDLCDFDTATHQYLVVRKCGYTTPDAVRIVGEALGTDPRQVTYAGRKDEDGITEQIFAMPVTDRRTAEGQAPWAMHQGSRWIEVTHYGFGHSQLSIGVLPGNCFRIIARNLAPDATEWLVTARKRTAFFINYYDTQRFGVPGGPKRTHYIGAAILAGDWDAALRELRELKVPESSLARQWEGPAESFFCAMDQRESSFYLASHASACWNTELSALVSSVCQDSYPVTIEGLAYQWARSEIDAASVLAQAPTLAYNRYWFTDNGLEVRRSERTTVIQCVVDISEYQEDEAHPGRARVTLSLFLPSGCYATTAVRQVLGHRSR